MEDVIAITAYQFVQELCQDLSSGKLELPSFPDAVVKIQETLNNENCTVEHVARAVSLDPVIAGRLMDMANSVVYNRGSATVTDIRTAISRVGLDMVRNTSVAIATQQLLRAKELGPMRDQLKRLWEHSVEVAAIAYVFARKVTGVNPDEAMLAGLMHDIGKFYILARAASQPELFDDPSDLDELVQEWHTGIGRAILEAWNFPPTVALAADEHEILDRAPYEAADVTDVILVANLHAHLRNGKSYKNVDLDALPAWRKLGLDLAASLELLQTSKQQLSEMQRLMGG